MLPWLDQPVLLHSSRATTCMLTPAQCEYKNSHWRFWYEADHVYGYATIYFMCAVIGVFTIANIISLVSKRSKTNTSTKTTSWRKIKAVLRFLSYKGFHLRGLKWYSPSLGVMLLGIVGAVYFFGLTLGPKPYYWPNTEMVSYGGSPPIATRGGWMSLALLPFVLSFAAKANFVTVLTGISHEKLQVFHRWTSWTMFVLALVHTFPFIVVHIQAGDMMLQWGMAGGVFYWSGIAALIPQAYLNLFSIAAIRNRYYEFFKVTHHIAACVFIVFLFIHCDFTLTSWDYFIAALSIYSTTVIYTFFRTAFNSLTAEAHLSLLPDSSIRVTIPTKMTWQAGQHVFLKFYASEGFHWYTSHPFTITSLPAAGKMVFYIRPHQGITKYLRDVIGRKFGTMPMSIDGPYGDKGVASTLASHDKVILIAGGSGSSFLFPIIESLLNVEHGGPEVQVIIAVRHSDSASWLLETLEELMESNKSGGKLKITIQITDEGSSPSRSETTRDNRQSDTEKNTPREVVSSQNDIKVVRGKGRPDLKELISSTTKNSAGASVGISACGPSSMMLDVRNECAAAQLRIIKSNGGVRELWLHTESFSW